MKKLLLGFLIIVGGVVGYTSAFNITVEKNYVIGGLSEGSFIYDYNRPTGDGSSQPYNVSYLSGRGGNIRVFQNFGYIFNSSGNWSFGILSPFGQNEFLYIGDSFFASGDYNKLPYTYDRRLTYYNDRDSIRVFVDDGTFIKNNTYNLSTLGAYDTLWRATADGLNIYKKGTQGPVITNDLSWADSVWRGPGNSFSTIDCSERGDNYCQNPKFYASVYPSITADKLQNNSSYLGYQFQLLTYVSRGNWTNRDSRPYTFLGILSGNAIEFTIYSCYQNDINILKKCDVVIHGITQDIFGMNYMKPYDNTENVNREVGAGLGHALFGNNTPYVTTATSTTSLGNYFSRIDMVNKRLYVASIDTPAYVSPYNNSIGYTELGKTNVAEYFTGDGRHYDNSFSGKVLDNQLASCSGHYNDPAYPGCMLFVDTYTGNDFSPFAPGLVKDSLVKALYDSGYQKTEYDKCKDITYNKNNNLFCDNIRNMYEGSNNIYDVGKFGQCPRQFVVSSENNISLYFYDIPFVGGLLKSFHLPNYSLLSPFSCVYGAIKYGLSSEEDLFSMTGGTSYVTVSDTSRNKWDLFMNFIFSIPALYLIIKKGLI